MKLFKNKKGITLVELLAVLVILGIIAAIAVPTVSTLISNTQDRANVESANSYVQAARLYSLSNPEATSVTNGALDGDVSNKVTFGDTIIFGFNAGSGVVDAVTPAAATTANGTSIIWDGQGSFELNE